MHRRTLSVFLTGLPLALALAGSSLGQMADSPPPPPPDIAGEPGYLDFDKLELATPEESKVVVNLYGPVLRMVAELTKGDEAGFSDLVVKLRAIRAKIWQVAPNRTEALRRSMTDLARRLEQDKWQTAVELRTGSGELSLILLRTAPTGEILGLAVLFVDTSGEAGAINIVGNVTPEEIGRLGRSFKIESLTRFEDAEKKPGS